MAAAAIHSVVFDSIICRHRTYIQGYMHGSLEYVCMLVDPPTSLYMVLMLLLALFKKSQRPAYPTNNYMCMLL